MDKQDLQARVDKIQWFHNYELAPGVMTHGTSDMLERGGFFQIPSDLTGKRVLDIGCSDGYFTFLAESRGAEVVSIDAWPRAGFFLAHEVLNSKAKFYHMNVYDIHPNKLGLFDIVFFFGVYYHLKNPILALERVASVTRGYAIVESEIMPQQFSEGEGLSRFYENRELNGDPTNWWVPNVPCFLQTIRAAGFPRVEMVTCYHDRRGVARAYKGPRTAGKMLTEDYYVAIDAPAAEAQVDGTVSIDGWALSQLEPQGGIERIVIYLDHLDDPACELGEAHYGSWRADLTTHFGEAYGPVGFQFAWNTAGVSPGKHTLYVMAEGKKGWHSSFVPVAVGAGGTSQAASAQARDARAQDQAAPQDLSLTKLELALSEAEVARLRALVAGYERGRFIRLIKWLHSLTAFKK